MAFVAALSGGLAAEALGSPWAGFSVNAIVFIMRPLVLAGRVHLERRTQAGGAHSVGLCAEQRETKTLFFSSSKNSQVFLVFFRPARQP